MWYWIRIIYWVLFSVGASLLNYSNQLGSQHGVNWWMVWGAWEPSFVLVDGTKRSLLQAWFISMQPYVGWAYNIKIYFFHTWVLDQWWSFLTAELLDSWHIQKLSESHWFFYLAYCNTCPKLIQIQSCMLGRSHRFWGWLAVHAQVKRYT